MSTSERIEELTGEPPSRWAVELYKVAFLLVGGAYIGWVAGAAETAGQPPGVFGETVAAAPPEWLAWLLVPGTLYLIVAAFPWPGLGSGGLSM